MEQTIHAPPVLSGRIPRRQLVVGGATLLLLLAMVAGWLLEIHAVRLKELRYRLKAATDQNTSVRTLSLVSRFRLLLRQRGFASETASNNREASIMQILADTAYHADSDNLNLFQIPVKKTIDFFNWISGAPAFRYDHLSREQRLLERAFYHEITRNYGEAILAYQTAFDSNHRMPIETKSYTLLHLGFCKALAGDRKRAETDFLTVLASDADAEYKETAKQLLQILSEINSQLAKVDALPLSLEKATAYYHLTAYKQAADTFKTLPGIENNSEALHYLGRSQEEMGDTTAAVHQYRRSIALNPQSRWAVKANRRLFALGSFYAAGKEYRIESKDNVTKGRVSDITLLKDAERFEAISERIEAGEKLVVSNLIPIRPAEPVADQKTNQQQEIATKTEQEKKPEGTPGKKLPPPPASLQNPRPTPPLLEKTTPPTVHVAPPAEAQKIPEVKPAAPPRPDWEKLELLPRAEKIAFIRTQRLQEVITLNNGNQFTGVVIAEDKDKVLLFTSLGKVVLDPRLFESRLPISAPNAIRK